MPRALARSLLLASLPLALGALVPSARAGTPKPGEVRAVYRTTTLRQSASPLSPAVATLPANTQVRVLEVKGADTRSPWVRVQAGGATAGQASGWLRAQETVETSALAAGSPPPVIQGSGGAVSSTELSAAGRQFDEETEQRYRASHADLGAAYAQVTAMENATQALPPADALAFIAAGDLGRPDADWARPARLRPTPPRKGNFASFLKGVQSAGGLLRGLPHIPGVKVPSVPLPKLSNADWKRAELAVGFLDQMKSEGFTPDHEYYLGRAVAANAIAKYGLDPDPRRTAYVRLVGEAIVRLSDRIPPNLGGYHFAVLDSDAVNAISGPGGFVLITRGAVEACQTEDELAAILCHELAHITRKHAETIVRQSQQWQSGLKATEGLLTGLTGWDEGRWQAQMLNLFTQAVGQMVSTATEHDYGRAYEFDADLEGTYILMTVVYDHTALRTVLQRLASRPGQTYGRSDTHAPPQVRAAQLDPVLQRAGPFRRGAEVLAFRRRRFDEALGRAATAPPGR